MSRPSRAQGVGNEVNAPSDVVSARTSCTGNGRCAGVVEIFQVVEKVIEPRLAVAISNLLAKACVRATLSDKCEPLWREVPVIFEALSLVRDGCNAEGLAGARSCPNRSIV
jgi:ferredoxin